MFEGWKQVICERNHILAVICMCIVHFANVHKFSLVLTVQCTVLPDDECLWFESWLSFSSVNFLIYCSVGEKFKKVVVRFLRTNILKNMASSGENLVSLKKVFHSNKYTWSKLSRSRIAISAIFGLFQNQALDWAGMRMERLRWPTMSPWPRAGCQHTANRVVPPQKVLKMAKPL